MLPLLHTADADDLRTLTAMLNRHRLSPAALLAEDAQTSKVRRIMQDVAERGDAALVDIARTYDDPAFTPEQLLAEPGQMRAALDRIDPPVRRAMERSIEQVSQYQRHIMPATPQPLEGGGVSLHLRLSPIASAGLYVPGGKASYPSSLIMLAVPAQVAGVRSIIPCTPPSPPGRDDLVLAAACLLGLPRLYRAGGPAAIAAMAFGTATVPAVDLIVGPGNAWVQTAKRLVAGAVGTDGFLGPSEVVVLADGSADPVTVAADLLAQAEHDPGRCFLVTSDVNVADAVNREIETQLKSLSRDEAIHRALAEGSAAIITADPTQAIEWINRLAAEHVSVQTEDPDQTLSQIVNAGCVFLGPHSPVAAGDYLAGPSHCLPTNTTARFASGISAWTFLKRGSVVRYTAAGIATVADDVQAFAHAEGLDAHAASVAARVRDREQPMLGR